MNNDKLRMAVIGVGHLGQAHARVLSALSEVELVGVVDANSDQADAVAARHQTQAFTEFEPLLDRVDAACIVVPTCLHHAVSTAFLEHGVHLLIEKPLAPTVEQAESIVELAVRNGCIVQVGHIERFNPAFEAIAGVRQQPKYIHCERCGPFTGRSQDVGAVLDLMVHDLDLVAALDPSPVVDVDAFGISVLGGEEDLVRARLRLTSGCVADLAACRIAPAPKRAMQIWSPEGFAGVDFMTRKLTLLQPSEQVRRRGLNLAAGDIGVREAIKAELFGTHLRQREQVCESPLDQLTQELRHFVNCVRTGAEPRVTGRDGCNAVALACRVLESVRSHAWDGEHCGPHDLPEPLGPLVVEPMRRAA